MNQNPYPSEGLIVFSKRGRDKGKVFVVISVDTVGEYLNLVDGRTRLLVKPKKKKIKHVQPTNYSVNLIPPCGRDLQDADIQKELAAFGY